MDTLLPIVYFFSFFFFFVGGGGLFNVNFINWVGGGG